MSVNSDAYRKRREGEARMMREETNKKLKTMQKNARRREQAMNCAKLTKELDNATCDEKGYIYGCKGIKGLTNKQLDRLEKYVKSVDVSDTCRENRLNTLKKIRKKLTGSSEKPYDKDDEQMITQRRIKRLQEEEQGLKF
tara:strand:- start:440 stop:859 length:420 start_codon:yes stop_codon:yes gene_type:complete